MDRSHLGPEALIKAAATFASCRNGVSVRKLAKDAGLAKKTSEHLLRLIRRRICIWEGDTPKLGGSCLAVELRILPKTFELNPPPSKTDGWRLVLLCRVTVIPIGKGSDSNVTEPVDLEEVRAVRLKDSHQATLVQTIETNTKSGKVFFFSGGRYRAETGSLDFETFKKREVSKKLDARLKILKRILITSHNGRLSEASADPVLAEFNFREEMRLNQTRYIADRVLELLLQENST